MTSFCWRRIAAGAMSAAMAGSILVCSGCGDPSTSKSGSPLVGMWGALDTDAKLELTLIDGKLEVMGACGWGGPLDGSAVPDAVDQFDVTGTYTSNIAPEPVHYLGTVADDTITLDVIDAQGNSRGRFTLIRNQQPPPFTGPCPG